MMMVAVSMGSSSSLSTGGTSVMVVLIAEIVHVGEVGHPAASIDSGWEVRRSRTSLTVL